MLNSNESNKSNVIDVPKSAISVTIPDSDKDALKIEITSESGVLALYDDDDTLTFSVGEALQGCTYEWILNGFKLTEENTPSVTISRAKHGEEFFKNKTESGEQALMLKITKGSKTYSGYVSFYNVEVPETSVSINLPEGFDSYFTTENKCRVSSMVDASTVRTLTLSATVKEDDASVKRVSYSSNNEGVATVNPSTGVVTFKENAHGDVTITATTVGGKTANVTFEVYNPTMFSTDTLKFLNSINAIMRQEFEQADSHFGGDWWAGGEWTTGGKNSSGTGIGFTFNSADSDSRENGTLTINVTNNIEISGIGNVTMKTDGVIYLKARQTGPRPYYIYDNPLEAIGTGSSGDLIVELPYNQGPIHIHYNNVVVDNGDTNRGGSYVIKSDKTLGYDMKVIDTEIPDGANVTKVLY